MFIYKYFKLKEENENLNIENEKLRKQIEDVRIQYADNKSKLVDEIDNLISAGTKIKSDYEELSRSYFKEKILLEKALQEKMVLTQKVDDLKHSVHQKVGSIGGLKRQNNKLKNERKEMLDLINNLIKELKKKPKNRPTLEELKRYFKNYY